MSHGVWSYVNFVVKAIFLFFCLSHSSVFAWALINQISAHTVLLMLEKYKYDFHKKVQIKMFDYEDLIDKTFIVAII